LQQNLVQVLAAHKGSAPLAGKDQPLQTGRLQPPEQLQAASQAQLQERFPGAGSNPLAGPGPTAGMETEELQHQPAVLETTMEVRWGLQIGMAGRCLQCQQKTLAAVNQHQGSADSAEASFIAMLVLQASREIARSRLRGHVLTSSVGLCEGPLAVKIFN
jgi:hypothetical protein